MEPGAVQLTIFGTCQPCDQRKPLTWLQATSTVPPKCMINHIDSNSMLVDHVSRRSTFSGRLFWWLNLPTGPIMKMIRPPEYCLLQRPSYHPPIHQFSPNLNLHHNATSTPLAPRPNHCTTLGRHPHPHHPRLRRSFLHTRHHANLQTQTSAQATRAQNGGRTITTFCFATIRRRRTRA
jgi:hypothetical protein